MFVVLYFYVIEVGYFIVLKGDNGVVILNFSMDVFGLLLSDIGIMGVGRFSVFVVDFFSISFVRNVCYLDIKFYVLN